MGQSNQVVQVLKLLVLLVGQNHEAVPLADLRAGMPRPTRF